MRATAYRNYEQYHAVNVHDHSFQQHVQLWCKSEPCIVSFHTKSAGALKAGCLMAAPTSKFGMPTPIQNLCWKDALASTTNISWPSPWWLTLHIMTNVPAIICKQALHTLEILGSTFDFGREKVQSHVY